MAKTASFSQQRWADARVPQSCCAQTYSIVATLRLQLSRACRVIAPVSTEPTLPAAGSLEGRKILILEDEAPIALNLASAVQQAGGTVVGPVSSVDAAHAAMADHRLDGALLDIRLRNETSFPLADVLAVLHVPFVFVSGLSSALMPYTHRERLLFDKPYETDRVIEALARLLTEREEAGTRASRAPG